MRQNSINHQLIKDQMENEEEQIEDKVAEMHKRTETMADGERYIIYYTFGGDEEPASPDKEVRENV